MRITKIGKIGGGQDGAILGNELFRLDERGNGAVYDLTAISEEMTPVATFRVDACERMMPHANSVSFAVVGGTPYLYANVYNNYRKTEDERRGMTCVYRIAREGREVVNTLVQVIEIGFVEDAALWRASPEAHGPRPFGNFLADGEAGALWVYTMRDEERGTRYFRFPLPSPEAGEWDEALGARRVVLTPGDIQEQFDMPYYRYIQGGAVRGGLLLSTEGFTRDAVNRPAIRAVDLAAHTETVLDLFGLGIEEEPEMIDFFGDTCYYSDYIGNLYELEI